jgi:hypothetical protein
MKFKLTGLRGDDSYSFRATLGLLSLLQEMEGWEDSKLHWEGVVPILTAPREDLVESLVTLMANRDQDPRWSWAGLKDETPKKAPSKKEKPKWKHYGTLSQYREKIQEFEEGSSPGALRWLRGVATDQVVNEKKEKNEAGEDQIVQAASPTPWDFKKGGGHQSVLSVAQDTYAKCKEFSPEDWKSRISKTLFGPWLMEDKDISGMGWVSAHVRSNAQFGQSIKNISRPLNLIAHLFVIESLSLFPVYGVNGQVSAPGFKRIEGKKTFTYPLWSNPLGFDSTMAVLDHPGFLNPTVNSKVLTNLGCLRVFRCSILPDPNQTNGPEYIITPVEIFAHPELL